MPLFNYTARSRAGERTEGSIDANDRHMALQMIERQGLVPISVREAGKVAAPAGAKRKAKLSLSLERHGRKARLKGRETLIFSRELSDLLASGMTLGNALHTLTRRTMPHNQETIITQLRDDVIQGSSLSDALAKWPETFSPLYVSLVRAGEASGQMSEVLERLCVHSEMVQEAKEQVTSALVYPAIVLCMGIGTMIFTMVVVVPKFSVIFEQLDSAMPLPTQMLIGFSSGMIKYGWIGVLAIAGLVFALRTAVRKPAGRMWVDRQKLRIPIVSRITVANAFAQFARTLGSLLRNGVPVLQALTIVENTMGNAVIAAEIREARERVTDGSTISGPLAQGKVFPQLLTDMLAVGEETGDMPGSLDHIARRYDSELARSVKMFTTILEPMMILLMAVLVGFVAVSMLMAVFDLTSGLNV